jgi:hypothetical protein
MIIYADTYDNLMESIDRHLLNRRSNVVILKMSDNFLKMGTYANGRVKIRGGKFPLISKMLTLSVKSLVYLLDSHSEALSVVGEDPWICITDVTEAKVR